MRRILPCILAAALSSGAAAQAQTFCDRPLPPEDLSPPQDDPEFRAFLNEEYKAYMSAMEDYLNCSQTEYSDSIEEQKRIINRWVAYFGNEAVLSSKYSAGAP